MFLKDVAKIIKINKVGPFFLEIKYLAKNILTRLLILKNIFRPFKRKKPMKCLRF